MAYSLPRWLDGAVPSARAWDTVADELYALELCLTASVVELSYEEGLSNPNATWPANVDMTINWQHSTPSTDSVSWTPAMQSCVFIRRPGTYLAALQVRYSGTIPAPGYTYGGSNSGMRYARIMLNGTAPASDTIAAAPARVGVAGGVGVTLTAWAMASLRPGDSLWCGTRHSSATPITSLNTDGGGTFLSVTRLGPGAPS